MKRKNNTIRRVLTIDEQYEKKQTELNVENILELNVNNKKIDVIKQDNKYRLFLNLKLITPPHLLNNENTFTYYDDILTIMNVCRMKLRFIYKSIDFKNKTLGPDLIEPKSPIHEDFINKSKNDFNKITTWIEYFIELSFENLKELEEKASYLLSLSNRLKFFNITIPTKEELDFLFDNVVLGEISQTFLNNTIICNTGEENQYYVKYLVVKDLKETLPIGWWEQLTTYGADMMVVINPLSQLKSEKIMDRTEIEVNSLKEATSSFKRKKQYHKKENIERMSYQIISQANKLNKVQIILKFYDTDLNRLNQRINKVIKEQSNKIILGEKINSLNELDEFYLGFDSDLIPKITLDDLLLHRGAGFFFNSIIQEGGFVLCNKNDCLVCINEDDVNYDNGQGDFNELILGTPGGGKSALMKQKALRFFCKGDKIHIIDFAKEYRQLANLLNANIITLPNNRLKLNPFEIITILDADGKEQIDFPNIKEFINILYPSTSYDIMKLENVIQKLYLDNKIKGKPTFSKYLQLFKDKEIQKNYYIDEEFIILFENIINNYLYFDGETNIDISKKVNVYDLQQVRYNKAVKHGLGFLITRIIQKEMDANKFYEDFNSSKTMLEQVVEWAKKKNVDLTEVYNDYLVDKKIGSSDNLEKEYLDIMIDIVNRNTPKIRLIVDECHNWIDDENIAKFILSITKEGRKYNAGVICTTQSIQSALHTSYQQELLTQFTYKYFFKMQSNKDIKLINEHLNTNFNSSIQDFLLSKKLEKGMGVLVISGQLYMVGVDIPPHWKTLFNGGN